MSGRTKLWFPFIGMILTLSAACTSRQSLPTRAVLIPTLLPAPTMTSTGGKATPVVLDGQSAGSTLPGDDLATAVPTASPTASPSPVPTMTFTPLPTDTPEPAGPTPTPIVLNGVSMEDVIILDEETEDHIREIFASGQELGRDPDAFSRLGASIVATHHFLGRWDTGPYDLGPYTHLQPVIDHYQGSYERVGNAAIRGLTALAVFNPTWSSEEDCLPNENVVDCEFRLHNPSILLVALGTNDKWDTVGFEKNLRRLVEYAIDQGVIPVLATKADRFEGEDNRNNVIIRQIAEDYAVPLLDFDLIAETLPGRGMGDDGVHLTIFDYYDYNMELAYFSGYGLYNLTTLIMLDQIWQQVSQS
jgi:hypothetical protein